MAINIHRENNCIFYGLELLTKAVPTMSQVKSHRIDVPVSSSLNQKSATVRMSAVGSPVKGPQAALRGLMAVHSVSSADEAVS